MLTMLPLLVLLMLAPLGATAQVEPVDLTSVFVAGGVRIDRLLVYRFNGIVLIRGRTGNRATATQAAEFAQSLGYTRVANLVQIVPAIADEGIERVARRHLEMSNTLQGCRFELVSRDGVVSLSGQVVREMQSGFAVHLLEKVDGVVEVRSALTMRPPAVPDE